MGRGVVFSLPAASYLTRLIGWLTSTWEILSQASLIIESTCNKPCALKLALLLGSPFGREPPGCAVCSLQHTLRLSCIAGSECCPYLVLSDNAIQLHTPGSGVRGQESGVWSRYRRCCCCGPMLTLVIKIHNVRTSCE